jgi:excisionase family DNA binding protein
LQEMESNPNARLLSVPEIAARLCVQPSTVHRLRKDGRIELTKWFGKLVIREADLAAWIDEEWRKVSA